MTSLNYIITIKFLEMKYLKKPLKSGVLLLGVGTMILGGCQPQSPLFGPDETNTQLNFLSEPVYNNTQTVRNVGPYLDFAFYEDFETTRLFQYHEDSEVAHAYIMKDTDAQSPRELAQQLGFRSMGLVYEEVMAAQQAYVEGWQEKIEGMSEDELAVLQQNPPAPFAPVVYANQDWLHVNEGAGTITLKVRDHELAYLLSPEGVISAGGAIYQYTGDQVKFLVDGNPTHLNELLHATSDDPSANVRVSTLEINPLTQSNQIARTGALTCRGDQAGFVLYHTGKVEHYTYTTYSYEYQCAYDSDYYNCWYSQTSGMPYEQKLSACCPRVYTPSTKHRFWTEINSRTDCPFRLGPLCLGGSESFSVEFLQISGSYSYILGGTTRSFGFTTTSGVPGSRMSRTLYDGNPISTPEADVDFRAVQNIQINTVGGVVFSGYDATCNVDYQ
ncbi:MAG TPA: hypothetical protein DCE41_01340 [Cytophagales bacterium]|nr:hypothetical protein [Cytophagales bacterium]HAP65116.1 hypothetical protein [Cytophagales bacterium]